MKTIYFILFLMLLLLARHASFAQLPQFIGATYKGGANNLGVIYKSNLDGSAFTSVYSFSQATGYFPQGKLVQAANKLLYGANYYGGAYNYGCLSSYDPVKNIYKDVFDFDMTQGSSPWGGLLLANNGLLYGTTYQGGFDNYGTIYSFNPATNVYTLLKQFLGGDANSGASPTCTLIQGNDGKLYGTTGFGGTNGSGVIFSVDVSDNTYTKLYDFTSEVGYPYGALVQAANGSFYGFAQTTDDFNNVVYVFNPSTKTTSFINNFEGITGYASTLVRDNLRSYILHGSSSDTQFGELFTINTFDNSYHKEHAFTATDGSVPTGELLNINNNIYGVTYEGGANNTGVMFEQPSMGSFKVLHSFTSGAGGKNPIIGLIKVSCTQAPRKPGTISGSTTVTCTARKTYSIEPVSGATSYKWVVPTGAIIQGNSNGGVISVKWGSQGGNISVRASNDCGTSARRTLSVTVTCNNIELATANSKISSAASVFPNPTTGNISVKFYSADVSKYTIRVIDMVGRNILTHEINATKGENILSFNLDKPAKGIYRVELIGEDNKQILKVEVQ